MGRDLGLRTFRPRLSRLLPMLLVASFVFFVAYAGLLEMYGLSPAEADEAGSPSAGAPGEPDWAAPLGVVASVVIAPASEELFLRGILFTGFRSHHGRKKAAIASAVVSAIYHLEPVWFPSRLLVGVVCAALLDETRSIWPSVLQHAAWNGLVEVGDMGFCIFVILLRLGVLAVVLWLVWYAVHGFWQHMGRSRPFSSS